MRFLFVDRILHLSPGRLVRGIKHITRDDIYLCANTQGQHYFIPSLIGETLGQLAAWGVMVANEFTMRPVAGIVASAHLYRPAYVGETLLLESVIDSLDNEVVQYHSVAYVGEDIVFRIDGALGPLLPMNDFIEEHEVRQQFKEINRPGDWPKTQITNSESTSVSIAESSQRSCSIQFDRILKAEQGVSLSAEKCISRTAPYFPDHFPKKPVLPLTILLEAKLNLAREFVARASYGCSYTISELRKIKMNEFIHPGDVVTCHVKVKQRDAEQLILNFRSEVEGNRVCVLEVVMTATEKNNE